MAKLPTIQNIAAGYGSNTLINNNFQALRDHHNNVISRDGSTPNAMQADLDMGGNDIINVGTITYTITNFAFEKDFFINGTPDADEMLYRYVSTFVFQIPVNFNNSYARCVAAPTLDWTISVRKDGVELGTITYAAGSTSGVFLTTGDSTLRTFNPGDNLEFVADNFQDVTLVDVHCSIVGNFFTT